VISLARERRGLLLCGILLCAALGYVALALGISRDVGSSERQFGHAGEDSGRQLRIYVEIVAVDAVNESTRMRISFAPNLALQGRRPDTADRDVHVQLGDGGHVEDLKFYAQDTMPPATFNADLNDGTVISYPLDRFRAALHIAAQEESGLPIPLQVTIWDGVAGWTPKVEQDAGSSVSEARFRIDFKRSAALQLLVLAIYSEMVLIGLVALTIGSLIFLGAKPAESTLMGALAGMVFALPVLRYALPGSPLLGVRADFLIFFPAELAMGLGLVLFMTRWARTTRRN
jgi:hypothetical protein